MMLENLVVAGVDCGGDLHPTIGVVLNDLAVTMHHIAVGGLDPRQLQQSLQPYVPY